MSCPYFSFNSNSLFQITDQYVLDKSNSQSDAIQEAIEVANKYLAMKCTLLFESQMKIDKLKTLDQFKKIIVLFKQEEMPPEQMPAEEMSHETTQQQNTLSEIDPKKILEARVHNVAWASRSSDANTIFINDKFEVK